MIEQFLYRSGRCLIATYARLLLELNVQWHYILAMTVVTMVPVVLVFVFLQRFITTGIAGAGLK